MGYTEWKEKEESFIGGNEGGEGKWEEEEIGEEEDIGGDGRGGEEEGVNEEPHCSMDVFFFG